jgi:hypothetical protein
VVVEGIVIGRRAASRGGMGRVLVMYMESEVIDFFVWRMALCKCDCEMLEQRYRWEMDHEEEVKRVTARTKDKGLGGGSGAQGRDGSTQ